MRNKLSVKQQHQQQQQAKTYHTYKPSTYFSPPSSLSPGQNMIQSNDFINLPSGPGSVSASSSNNTVVPTTVSNNFLNTTGTNLTIKNNYQLLNNNNQKPITNSINTNNPNVQPMPLIICNNLLGGSAQNAQNIPVTVVQPHSLVVSSSAASSSSSSSINSCSSPPISLIQSGNLISTTNYIIQNDLNNNPIIIDTASIKNCDLFWKDHHAINNSGSTSSEIIMKLNDNILIENGKQQMVNQLLESNNIGINRISSIHNHHDNHNNNRDQDDDMNDNNDQMNCC